MRMILLLLVLSGCPGSISAPLEFTAYNRYEPPSTESLWPTRPTPAVAGSTVEHDGLLVTKGTWTAIREELDRLRDALREAYRLVEESRRAALVEDSAKRDALTRCRKSKAETLAVGLAIGAGACASLERAAAVLVP